MVDNCLMLLFYVVMLGHRLRLDHMWWYPLYDGWPPGTAGPDHIPYLILGHLQEEDAVLRHLARHRLAASLLESVLLKPK
jgi:hypothetical protein